MKLATRINSFFRNTSSLIDVLDQLGKIEGLTHVDLNYPEHFNGLAWATLIGKSQRKQKSSAFRLWT